AWHWELMFTAPLQVPESSHQHEILERVGALVDGGALRATTTTVLHPLDAATLREGHRLVESGHMVGKVVVRADPI
ncbi:MAG: zinc-binding dehydrogenase, partial [Cellulomonas sp.]|nr:zinc-binding dehydrogenase [Cellulomonas sp.]